MGDSMNAHMGLDPLTLVGLKLASMVTGCESVVWRRRGEASDFAFEA
jgi:hypothetical protein